MLKIGVLGAGHLGKIHIRLLLELKEIYELVGFYDPNEENSEEVKKTFNIKKFSGIDALLEAVDCVDVVTPTLSHFDCCSIALRKSKHVFIDITIGNLIHGCQH